MIPIVDLVELDLKKANLESGEKNPNQIRLFVEESLIKEHPSQVLNIFVNLIFSIFKNFYSLDKKNVPFVLITDLQLYPALINELTITGLNNHNTETLKSSITDSPCEDLFSFVLHSHAHYYFAAQEKQEWTEITNDFNNMARELSRIMFNTNKYDQETKRKLYNLID